MEKPDYDKLGFKCGIEIHQELNTKKLFCSCSSAMAESAEIFTIERKMRSAAGETGDVDAASAYEEFRDRKFVYHGYSNEACLVDTDSEPPHPVDADALDIALGFAKMAKLDVPDVLCVMRKTVTDGSAVSGFQRTILVGLEGKDSFLPQSGVKITQLNLEEDASKIMEKKGNTIHYSLSRLGIPLLEIGTAPTIKDPEHAKETCLEIGMMLRSFDVKRGIGTIRQDVNISIKGGSRTEVKGWQDLKTLPLLVENEVMRQKSLLDIKDELKTRGLKKFDKISRDCTDIFRDSANKIIKKCIDSKGVVLALVLPKFSGLLKQEVCTGKTFGRELSEYAKAYGTKGMIHTDEDLKKYGLEKEFSTLRKDLKAKDDDLIIIIAEKEQIAKKAVDSVYDRVLYCLKGVPEETRIPNHANATSSYARPLPGAHRMYPETDVPLIPVTKKLLDSVVVPELITTKISRLAKKHKIESYKIEELLKLDLDIDELVKTYKNITPQDIAKLLVDIPKEAKKRFDADIDIIAFFPQVLDKINKKEISKDAALEIFVSISKGKPIDYSRYEVMDDEELEKKIKAIIKKNKDAPINALIGLVMKDLRGKAPGKKIVELIKKNAG